MPLSSEAVRTDVWGPDGAEPGWAVTTTYTLAEMQRLLAAYDPSVGTSPGVADARPVLRSQLNAVIETGVTA
jgi:hypothetical protein